MVDDFATWAHGPGGLKVWIIAGCGGAAHGRGWWRALTPLAGDWVPVAEPRPLGFDSLLSMRAECRPGIPWPPWRSATPAATPALLAPQILGNGEIRPGEQADGHSKQGETAMIAGEGKDSSLEGVAGWGGPTLRKMEAPRHDQGCDRDGADVLRSLGLALPLLVLNVFVRASCCCRWRRFPALIPHGRP